MQTDHPYLLKTIFKINFKFIIRNLKYLSNSKFLIYILIIISSLLLNCSSSKRFTSEENTDDTRNVENIKTNVSSIRILLDEKPAIHHVIIESEALLFSEENKISKITKGTDLQFYIRADQLFVKINDVDYEGDYFQLIPNDGEVLFYNQKSYKGSIRVVPFGNYIDIINFVDIENYLKGVIAREMPLGNGNENFEALKAFAICARTYALKKINNGNSLFDIFADTRDQVYGGEFAEQSLSNKAVDETEGIILLYNNEPATVYYHSTCGGVSESVENVFPQLPLPYLISIKDGTDPYCKISPLYEWEEVYSESQLIDQLYNAGLIDKKSYSIEEIKVISRFESGRVHDLQILLSGKEGNKELHLYGNDIRSQIRTQKNGRMLWSTLFTIERKSDGDIVFKGKGYGHGVGLCQWGAIGQSQNGIDYKRILEHYFPGTELGRVND